MDFPGEEAQPAPSSRALYADRFGLMAAVAASIVSLGTVIRPGHTDQGFHDPVVVVCLMKCPARRNIAVRRIDAALGAAYLYSIRAFTRSNTQFAVSDFYGF